MIAIGDRLVEIRITKATLFLTERELLDNLPRELLAVGFRRGKSILRRRQMERRFPDCPTASGRP